MPVLGDTVDCARPRTYFSAGVFTINRTGCDVARITHLNCSKLGVRTIPDSLQISEMGQLQIIDLSDNADLERIPERWGTLPNLTRLELWGTAVANLPHTLCNVARQPQMGAGSIVLVAGGQNAGAKVPPVATRLDWSASSPRRDRLAMSEGCLDAFGATLERWNLSKNELTLFEVAGPADVDTMKRLPRLKSLDISNNQIEHFSSASFNHFDPLFALQGKGNSTGVGEEQVGVLLAYNPFKTLDWGPKSNDINRGWFRAFTAEGVKEKIEKVTCRGCRATANSYAAEAVNELNGFWGTGFELLSTLNFEGNALTNDELKAFGSLFQIEKLDLSYNKLSGSITGRAFAHMSKLKRLVLDKNKIESFSWDGVGEDDAAGDALLEVGLYGTALSAVGNISRLTGPRGVLQVLNLTNNTATLRQCPSVELHGRYVGCDNRTHCETVGNTICNCESLREDDELKCDKRFNDTCDSYCCGAYQCETGVCCGAALPACGTLSCKMEQPCSWAKWCNSTISK